MKPHDRGESPTLYEQLMAHLDACSSCGATRGLPCYAAGKILESIAQEAAEAIAPMPKEAPKA